MFPTRERWMDSTLVQVKTVVQAWPLQQEIILVFCGKHFCFFQQRANENQYTVSFRSIGTARVALFSCYTLKTFGLDLRSKVEFQMKENIRFSFTSRCVKPWYLLLVHIFQMISNIGTCDSQMFRVAQVCLVRLIIWSGNSSECVLLVWALSLLVKNAFVFKKDKTTWRPEDCLWEKSESFWSWEKEGQSIKATAHALGIANRTKKTNKKTLMYKQPDIELVG